MYMATVHIKNQDVHIGQFRIYEGEFPPRLRSARQQYQNMFEIPILFYLLCILNIIFDSYNDWDIIMAWGFVIFRVMHFFIRLQNQKNINIIPRTLVFMTSLVAALAFGGNWYIHDKDSIKTSFPDFLKIIKDLKNNA